MRQLPPYWNAYHGGRYKPADEVETAVDAR